MIYTDHKDRVSAERVKVSFPVKNNIGKEYFNERYLRKKELERRAAKSRQRARLTFSIVFFLILSILLPNVFFNTYDQLFFRRIKNAAIKVPSDPEILRSAEKFLENDVFLDTRVLGLVEAKKPLMKTIPLSRPMYSLTNKLKYLVNQNPQLKPGIFIWDYSTGKYVDINADQEIPTASIIKIPVLLELYRRQEMGLINFNNSLMMTKYYITDGSGYLQYKPVGSVYKISTLAQLMIQESDNTATNMLLSNIGGINELNRAMRLWGFSKTHLSDLLPDIAGTNVSTPKDMATMLYNLENPDFLSLKSRAEIIDIMSNVRNRFLIKAGLPDNVQFIHKTGNIGSMIGDAGVVMLPDGRKYVIVVMVKRPRNAFAAKQLIIDASKITYNSYMSRDL